MSLFTGCNNTNSFLCNNTKVVALETSIKRSLSNFKELIVDFEQLQIDSENYKAQVLLLKDKCASNNCPSAEELKKIIASKDNIIHSVTSILTTLNETKNLDILTEVFNILLGNTRPLTPPLENKDESLTYTEVNKSSEKQSDETIEEVSFKEESLCEIEGTPTGRVSPIIETKKSRAIGKSSDVGDKKKCPDNWPTPERKAVKLTYGTPKRTKSSGGGRLRQSRLNLVKAKHTSVVDLTCSPEFSGGKRSVARESVQTIIKKESFENDDTIFPSPTSGPVNFSSLKSNSKQNANTFKKPGLSLKNKKQSASVQDENNDNTNDATTENTIDIMNQFNNRLQNGVNKETPLKVVSITIDDDLTRCDTDGDDNMSLLQQIDQLEQENMENQSSPAKRPLLENINILNTPPKQDPENSISILPQQSLGTTTNVENVKRKIPELVEPIYKEPAARKKADKRALQGWSCDECKNFYGELYKDDPVMLAKKIEECSKHRGRHNPVRPKTPPNFWNPRWDVPDDTEELNRMNNAN